MVVTFHFKMATNSITSRWNIITRQQVLKLKDFECENWDQSGKRVMSITRRIINLNLRRNLLLLLSTRCHLSFFSSYSLLLSPLIWSTLPSSTSTFTSSFLNLGRSALKTWASGFSFQSICVLAKAEVLPTMLGMLDKVVLKGKLSKGSQMSREKGSKMLLRWPPPITLGMSDIFYECCWIDLLSWTQASNNFLMMKLTERALLYIGREKEEWDFLRVSEIFLP